MECPLLSTGAPIHFFLKKCHKRTLRFLPIKNIPKYSSPLNKQKTALPPTGRPVSVGGGYFSMEIFLSFPPKSESALLGDIILGKHPQHVPRPTLHGAPPSAPHDEGTLEKGNLQKVL